MCYNTLTFYFNLGGIITMEALVSIFSGNPLFIVLLAAMIVLPIILIINIIVTRKLKKGLFSVIAGFIATKIFKKDKKDKK